MHAASDARRSVPMGRLSETLRGGMPGKSSDMKIGIITKMWYRGADDKLHHVQVRVARNFQDGHWLVERMDTGQYCLAHLSRYSHEQH